MRPGRMTLTVMPSAAISPARVLENATRLDRSVLEMPSVGIGWTTPDEMAESVEEWRRFAREPGSIYMSAWVEAVGIKL